jgi:hypothetical protein
LKTPQYTAEEELEFKQNVEWIAINYPRIAGEASKVMTMTHIAPFTREHTDNYDPLLQLIQESSLKELFSRSYAVEDFKTNLKGSKTLLLAYLGYLKK